LKKGSLDLPVLFCADFFGEDLLDFLFVAVGDLREAFLVVAFWLRFPLIVVREAFLPDYT